jgi:hypothetical protein
MGADFLFTTVDLLDGEEKTIDGLMRLWRSRVDALSKENMDEDAIDRFNLDEDDDGKWLEAAKKILHEDLDTILEAINEERRDASLWTPPRSEWNGKPTVILITGGMSYGDSPTDVADVIFQLYEEKIIQWGDKPEPKTNGGLPGVRIRYRSDK